MSVLVNKVIITKDSLLNKILRIVFPIKCVGCGELSQGYICSSCRQTLVEFKPECFITRQPSLDWGIINKVKSSTCFEKVYYFYKYDLIMHNLLLDIKYNFYKDKLKEFPVLLQKSKEFQNIKQNNFDIITYVPISNKRLRWRGFNQSKHLALYISKFLLVPVCQLLVKNKNTTPQIELSREERLQNLKDTFQIKANIPINLSDQSILLVDDVCTTGSTLEECAKTLKSHYPNLKIYGMCLARGEK